MNRFAWWVSRYAIVSTRLFGNLVVAAGLLSLAYQNPAEEISRFEKQDNVEIAKKIDPKYITKLNGSANSPRGTFENITPLDGLSSPFVNSIMQDDTGFIWLGTELGLNRFDGFNFLNFTEQQGDSDSIRFDSVWKVYQDRNGVMWVGGGGGLDRYESMSETFTHIDTRGQVFDILQDSQGILWVGFWHGLYAYDPITGEILHSYSTDSNELDQLQRPARGSVRVIFEDRLGRFWLGLDGGLDLFDRQNGTFTHFVHDPNQPKSLSANMVTSIFQDSQGELWVGTNDGLNRLVDDSGKFIHYHSDSDPNSLTANFISAIIEDKQGRLWVGTNNGLNLYNRLEDNFYNFNHEPFRQDSLANDTVNDLFVDHSGVLWVATNRGISKYNRRSEQFVYYPASIFQNDLNENSDKSQIRTGCLGEDDIVWIGLDDGRLVRFNFRTRESKIYLHEDIEKENLISNRIDALARAPDGTLWVGFGSGWIERFDPTTGKFDKVRYLSDKPFVFINFDLSGSLWIGTHGDGLIRMDVTTGAVTHYVQFWTDPNHWRNYGSLSSHILTSYYLDENGAPWFGTLYGGINIWDSVKDRFTHFRYQIDIPTSLSQDSVLAISSGTENDPDAIWIGTLGGGLNRYDRNTGSFQAFCQSDGLPGDTVSSIVPDSDGYLWLGTNLGLSRFNPQDLTFQNFDRRDGFDMYLPRCLSETSDMILCASQEGFYIFNPLAIDRNTHVPPLVLTSFGVSGKPYNGNFESLERVRLNYKQNDLAFEFTSLDYTIPEKNQFAYMMEGLDRDWIQAGTRRYVEYRSLKSGEYTMRIKGSNNDGLWNEDGLEFPITIQPPFWQTWAFRILMMMGVFGLILIVFRWRMQIVQDRSRQLEMLVETRTADLTQANKRLEREIKERHRVELALAEKAAIEAVEVERNRLARELHDAVSQTLFSASLIAEVLPRLWQKNPQDGRRRLSELGILTRGALAEMRMLLLELRPAGFEEANMAELLHQLAESIGSRARLQVETGVIGNCDLPADVKLILYRITQEALNNVVKHAGAKSVNLALECDQEQLMLLIEDDGCGFIPTDLKPGSLGLGIMRERAYEIGASLRINSQPGNGTQIIIEWRMDQSQFKEI